MPQAPPFIEVPYNYLADLDDVTDAPESSFGGKAVWRFGGVSIADLKQSLRDVLSQQARDKNRRLKVRIRNTTTGKWVNLKDEPMQDQIGGWINVELVCKAGGVDF